MTMYGAGFRQRAASALAGLVIGLGFLGGAGDARAAFVSATDCLPQHKYFHAGPVQYGPVILTDVLHFAFTECNAPPVNIGDTTNENFGSLVSANTNLLGPILAPAQVGVRLTRIADLDANTRAFDTEMLQLDITGGTLPPGVMIRESPTLQSLGFTSIEDLGGGLFAIDSFFDVFTELSLDGGLNWIQSQGPARVELVPGPGTAALLGLGLVLLLPGLRRAARSGSRRGL